MHLAAGDEVEVFKNHYPVPTAMTVMFDTSPPIQKTVVLVRNPIDGYVAQSRHKAAYDDTKVGFFEIDSFLSRSMHKVMDPVDHGPEYRYLYAPMRTSTIGNGYDPDNIMSEVNQPRDYEHYLAGWVNFVKFWFNAGPSECTEVTFVRYEDLCDMNLIEVALEELLSITGMVPATEDAVQRAVEKYAPDLSRLGGDVYFNATVAQDSEIKDMIGTTIKAKIPLLEMFGYRQFLDDLWLASLPAVFG